MNREGIVFDMLTFYSQSERFDLYCHVCGSESSEKITGQANSMTNLARDELSICSTLNSYQVVMAAFFYNGALAKYYNSVSVSDCGKAMSNNNNSSPRHQSIKSSLYSL